MPGWSGLLVRMLRRHVPLRWRTIRRNHRARFAASSVVGVGIWSTWGHIWVVVIPRVLLVLHRRLAVHLVMLLVHWMMLLVLGMVVHVRRTTALLTVG